MATPTSLPASFSDGTVLTATQLNNLRGAFRVLQVVSTSKTDNFNTTSTTFVDITGLSVSITPSSTSSKIMVFFNCYLGQQSSDAEAAVLRVLRGSTGIYEGTAGTQNGTGFWVGFSQAMLCAAGQYLDSPSTTSATTYKLQLRSTNAGLNAYVGRRGLDTVFSMPSSITVMEISA